jgi:hypothetical protein
MAAGSTAYGDADEARAKARTPLPVPEWIALIRRLRAEGKQTEAGRNRRVSCRARRSREAAAA